MSEKLLLQPLKIGSFTVNNRIFMPPMATFKAEEDVFTEEVIKYYDEKTAGGGIGLCILEHAYVSKEGKAHPGQISIASDDAIPHFKRLADVIHKNGSVCIAQISHAGAKSETRFTGLPVYGVTDAVLNREETAPTPLTKEDIERITKCFADAAVRAQKAGLEGVELHMAHGYLMDQFYSPLINTRTDEYGGSLENRIRFPLAVVRAIREACGPDFIISVRLGVADYPAKEAEPKEGGAMPSESVQASVAFEQAGADIIDVSGGIYGTERAGYPGTAMFTDVSAMIKKAVSCTVAVAGAISTSEQCEKILEDGDADLVGGARILLKESGWALRMLKEVGE